MKFIVYSASLTQTHQLHTNHHTDKVLLIYHVNAHKFCFRKIYFPAYKISVMHYYITKKKFFKLNSKFEFNIDFEQFMVGLDKVA